MLFSEFAQINPKIDLDKGESYPFIEMEDLTPGRRYISAIKEKEFNGGGSRFQTEDIIFARITPCLEHGKIAQVKGRVNKKYFGSTEFFVFRAKDGISDKGFLFYLSYSDILRKPAEKSMYGASGRQRASLDVLKAIEVPDIPLKDQQKISSILSAYDDLIENNTRRIQILEEMAQRIYKEWFVEFRFPGHEKIKFIDSELGKIPEGWEIKRLSNIVETQYGYTESASEEIIGPKFLRGKDINKNSYINWDNVPYCKIKNTDYERYKLNVGDIIIIRMADPGKVGIVEKNIDAIFGSYLIRIKIKNGMDPYYLFYFFLSDKYQSYITGASTGTTRKSASAAVITGINILLPNKNILEQFAELIIPLRKLLNTLLEKNINLQQTRDLLLPKLISGELDISDSNIAIRGQEA